MRRFLAGGLAMTAVTLGAADRPTGRQFATRSVVYARHGMVAAAHPLAVQIGVDVLKRGGSAVDAAIAVNAALGFMEPMSCGIGGDLFAIVWDAKTGKLYGLNGSGRAPRALTADKVPPEPDGTIPESSPYAWTVPGAVDGWFELHHRFGRLPMSEVLAPAVKSAREGEPVPQVIAGLWGRGERQFKDKPGFAAVFLPGGHAPKEGEVFRNAALAAAYEALAREGRDAFYSGRIARDLVAFSKRNGGYFSAEDFAAHRSEWVEPLSTDYRGVRVFELPPNGQGVAALEMLNILESFDLRALGRESVAFWHTMVEAKKLAFEDRARYVADPAFAQVPIEGLLSKAYGREQAGRIDPARAAERIEAGHPPLSRGDTTYLAVADADGNMVSLIQSNYDGFGSGYALPEWGFAIQDRGALFDLKPGRPNSLEPGKRPFHTIIPAFATRDGKPWLAFGLMGGDMQPQGHAQVIVNLVDFGMNLQEAGDAARFYHQGSSEPTGTLMTTGGELHLESGVPVEVRRELQGMGHKVTETVGTYGGYQAVAWDPVNRVWAGASESRKDGCVIGY
ncbi:MAG: gamma-glutamyltransferase [Vicinamibacteria bacterium]